MGMGYDRRRSGLVAEALSRVGQRETEESLADQLVLYSRMFSGPVGELYCMGFIQQLLLKLDGASRGYRSWIYKGASCMDVWNRTPAKARLNYGQVTPGCLIIWQHFKNGRATNEGHVGVVIKARATWLETVEANMASGLSINKEGCGIYQRVRSLSGSDSMKVKGFLHAWDPSK